MILKHICAAILLFTVFLFYTHYEGQPVSLILAKAKWARIILQNIESELSTHLVMKIMVGEQEEKMAKTERAVFRTILNFSVKGIFVLRAICPDVPWEACKEG